MKGLTLKHWLRARPMFVLLLAIVAPAAAFLHVVVTWGPESLNLQRITALMHDDAVMLEARTAELERARAVNAQLRDAVEGGAAKLWLGERRHFAVFDAFSRTLESAGARVEQLAFAAPGMYAFTPEGDVLACEEIHAVCRGPYKALTDGLDGLLKLDLPMRFGQLQWVHGQEEVELTIAVQVPFAPDDALARELRHLAGIEEDDDGDS